MLRVLESGKRKANENMQIDQDLLSDLSTDPILHLYDWEGPAGTYGYFINPHSHIKSTPVDFARRPTGGGIVFHIWDYAFSFLLPSHHPCFSETPLDNYRFVNGVVLEVMEEIFDLKNLLELIPESYPSVGMDCENFCMARPTKYDLIYHDKKIAGAAQRKTKKGYLHQGTISLCAPDETLLRDVLIHEKDLVDAMRSYTFAPLEQKDLLDARIQIGEKLKIYFNKLIK